MPTDNLDNKIREAADHLEPAYNEKAWEKMEKLLDEHLPQNKRRNRKLFWIFLILFLAAGSLILINRSGENENIANKENKIQKPAVNKNETVNSNKSLSKNKTIPPIVSSEINKQLEKNGVPDSFENNRKEATKKSTRSKDRSTITNKPGENLIEGNTFTVVTNSDDRKDAKQKNNIAEEQGYSIKDTTTTAKKSSEKDQVSVAPQVPGTAPVTTDQKDTLVVKNRSAKLKDTSTGKNKFSNSFFITVSGGPDVSAVTFDEIGKIKFAYGAGLGYSFGKKWNIRTGFYVVKKVYNAKPSSYNPPGRFWYNFPDLKSIEANCKVYEVPVIVSYNFSENSKSLWFGGVGLASYFMKKEVYDYNSKSPSGQSSYITYSVNDKNKHYFSIVRLSAGYEKKLSDQISFITEPYLAVPLAGVGYGKVKLYSSGILLTLKVKPFSKK